MRRIDELTATGTFCGLDALGIEIDHWILNRKQGAPERMLVDGLCKIRTECVLRVVQGQVPFTQRWAAARKILSALQARDAGEPARVVMAAKREHQNATAC